MGLKINIMYHADMPKIEKINVGDANFIYTKVTSDIQEDISNWVTNNREEIEESILEAINKTLN